MNFYQFHIGDYRGATAHLSNEEDVTYRRLIDMYYDTEQPIPLDTQWVSRRLRVGYEPLQSVLSDFFICSDDGWHNVRCDETIAEYHKGAAKNRENGKKGGRPSSKNNPVGSQSVPSGMPMATDWKGNQEPVTSNQEPRTINQELVTHKTKAKAPPPALPDWMPLASWSGYIEMRKAVKKPPTTRAIQLLTALLDKMRADGQDIAAVLDKSTVNNWTDVYPVKTDWSGAQGGRGIVLADVDGARRAANEEAKRRLFGNKNLEVLDV